MSDNFDPNSIRKIVSVQAPQAVVWRVFTEKMGAWWPLAYYKIGKANAVDAVIEREDCTALTLDDRRNAFGLMRRLVEKVMAAPPQSGGQIACSRGNVRLALSGPRIAFDAMYARAQLAANKPFDEFDNPQVFRVSG